MKFRGSRLAALFWAVGTVAAAAHPHVFAEARLEVVVAGDGTVTELRNVWRFDELFSSTVLLDFDANTDLKLQPDELADIGNVIRESLADYSYFTFITRDGKDIAITPPDIIHVDFQDNQLLLFFAVKPDHAIPLKGKLAFGVYDPTIYTAIDFVHDGDLVVEGNAGSCRREVVRPDPDEVLAQNKDKLTDAFFNEEATSDVSKFFATRLELTC